MSYYKSWMGFIIFQCSSATLFTFFTVLSPKPTLHICFLLCCSVNIFTIKNFGSKNHKYLFKDEKFKNSNIFIAVFQSKLSFCKNVMGEKTSYLKIIQIHINQNMNHWKSSKNKDLWSCWPALMIPIDSW